MVKRTAATCALALGAALWAGQVTANCRLALVLAMDVSASVGDNDYVLQRDGLANALNLDVIRNAILNGAPGTVALYVFEWSGRYQQDVIVDWTVLDSNGAIDDVIDQVAGHRRIYKEFPTAMGYALGYAAGQFDQGPHCDRKVIDISGDGSNNEGFPPETAYMHFPFDGVTVNGLVIQGREEKVLEYYQRDVVYGPGAFVEYAEGFRDFETAMGRKLFREINGMILGSVEGAQWSPG
ncbi:DUF1194 domain-containing protein [Pseudooceanicola sp. MF1-13]|uniref:DUF1194 domain-containing protein n=1 Tax=Pseudooceanicola sp. MF1-13 TaxID=3379095 RepID=UPI003891A816